MNLVKIQAWNGTTLLPNINSVLWSLQKLLSKVDAQYLPSSLLSSIYLVTMLKTAAAAVQVPEVGFNLNSCLAVVGVILDVDEMNRASKTAGLARTAFKTPRVSRPVENWSRVATRLLSTKCCIRHCTTNWRKAIESDKIFWN